MTFETWLAFVAASAVLLVIPGPTLLTVISYSVAHGRRARWPLVAGVALGDSTALAVSLVGLGGLLAASAMAFTVVKWVGGLYLLWLGTSMLRAGATASAVAARPAPASMGKLFANTWLVTALNPKGIIFFVAFLPQFVAPGLAPAWLQMLLLGPLLPLLAVPLFAVLIAGAGRAVSRLNRSARATRWLNGLAGTIFLGLGLRLLLDRR